MSPLGLIEGKEDLEKDVNDKLKWDGIQGEFDFLEDTRERKLSLGNRMPVKKKLSFDFSSMPREGKEQSSSEGSPTPTPNQPTEPQDGENLRKFVTDKMVKEQEKTVQNSSPVKLSKTSSLKGAFFKMPLLGLRRGSTGSTDDTNHESFSKSLPTDGKMTPEEIPRTFSATLSPPPKSSRSLSASPILKSFLGGVKKQQKQQEKATRQSFEENLPKCKVLLLGAGFAGKSTLFVQLQTILNKELDIPQFTAKVRYNCYQIAGILAKYMDLKDHPFGNVDWVDFLIENPRDKDKEKKIFKMLKDVIDFYTVNTNAPELFVKTPEYFDGAEHFMKLTTLQRVAFAKFVPGEEDYLLIRCKTIGITPCEFQLGGLQYTLIDVGGQQNERKKWKNCFQRVNIVIFVVSLSDFDEMVLNEGEGSNRMKEALDVFTLTVNGEVFTKTQFLLLFNKEDVLITKMTKKDTLVDAFPEYTGGQDVEAAKKFIIDLFMSKIKGDRQRFNILVKKAISREEITEFLKIIEVTAKNNQSE
jgi:GTPase SAR1 family protein